MTLSQTDGVTFLNIDLIDKNQRNTVAGDQNS